MNELFVKEGKVEYYYDPSTHIFYKIHMGKITLEDIMSTWKHIIDENKIPDLNRGFIVDFINADLLVPARDFILIYAFYEEHPSIFRSRKIGLVMNKPNQVIFPLLIESEHPTFFPRAFSSTEAAVDWILN